MNRECNEYDKKKRGRVADHGPDLYQLQVLLDRLLHGGLGIAAIHGGDTVEPGID